MNDIPLKLFVVTYQGREALITGNDDDHALIKAECEYGLINAQVREAFESDLKIGYSMGYIPRGLVKQGKHKQ